jgi:hypothetical protein
MSRMGAAREFKRKSRYCLIRRAACLWQYWMAAKGAQSSQEVIEQLTGQAVIYRTADRLMVLTISNSPLNLAIWESAERAVSLDDAEAKSLREASQLLPEIENGGFWKRYRRVRLTQVESEFAAGSMDADGGRVNLERVARREGAWEIVIDGPWKERVRLGKGFEFQAASQLK